MKKYTDESHKYTYKNKIQSVPLCSSPLDRYKQSYGVAYHNKSNDIRIIRNAAQTIQLCCIDILKKIMEPNNYFDVSTNYSNLIVLKPLNLINSLAQRECEIKNTILEQSRISCLDSNVLLAISSFLDIKSISLLKMTCRSMYILMTSNIAVARMIKLIAQKLTQTYFHDVHGYIVAFYRLIYERKYFSEGCRHFSLYLILLDHLKEKNDTNSPSIVASQSREYWRGSFRFFLISECKKINN